MRRRRRPRRVRRCFCHSIRTGKVWSYGLRAPPLFSLRSLTHVSFLAHAPQTVGQVTLPEPLGDSLFPPCFPHSAYPSPTHRSYPSHPPLPRLATATLIFIPHPYHLPSSPDTGQRPPGLTVPLGPLASQPPPTAWIPPLFFPRHRNRGLRAMLPLHLIPPSLRLRGSLIPEISPNK